MSTSLIYIPYILFISIVYEKVFVPLPYVLNWLTKSETSIQFISFIYNDKEDEWTYIF